MAIAPTPKWTVFRSHPAHAAVTPISLQPSPPEVFGFPAKRLRKKWTESVRK